MVSLVTTSDARALIHSIAEDLQPLQIISVTKQPAGRMSLILSFFQLCYDYWEC